MVELGAAGYVGKVQWWSPLTKNLVALTLKHYTNKVFGAS